MACLTEPLPSNMCGTVAMSGGQPRQRRVSSCLKYVPCFPPTGQAHASDMHGMEPHWDTVTEENENATHVDDCVGVHKRMMLSANCRKQSRFKRYGHNGVPRVRISECVVRRKGDMDQQSEKIESMYVVPIVDSLTKTQTQDNYASTKSEDTDTLCGSMAIYPCYRTVHGHPDRVKARNILAKACNMGSNYTSSDLENKSSSQSEAQRRLQCNLTEDPNTLHALDVAGLTSVLEASQGLDMDAGDHTTRTDNSSIQDDCSMIPSSTYCLTSAVFRSSEVDGSKRQRANANVIDCMRRANDGSNIPAAPCILNDEDTEEDTDDTKMLYSDKHMRIFEKDCSVQDLLDARQRFASTQQCGEGGVKKAIHVGCSSMHPRGVLPMMSNGGNAELAAESNSGGGGETCVIPESTNQGKCPRPFRRTMRVGRTGATIMLTDPNGQLARTAILGAHVTAATGHSDDGCVAESSSVYDCHAQNHTSLQRHQERHATRKDIRFNTDLHSGYHAGQLFAQLGP